MQKAEFGRPCEIQDPQHVQISVNIPVRGKGAGYEIDGGQVIGPSTTKDRILIIFNTDPCVKTSDSLDWSILSNHNFPVGIVGARNGKLGTTPLLETRSVRTNLSHQLKAKHRTWTPASSLCGW